MKQFFFTLLNLFYVSVFAQVVPLTVADVDMKKDSAFAKHFVDSLNYEIGDDTVMSGEMGHSKYYSGEFFYSPDHYFKILVLSGEGCGAYCNPMYESIVFFRKDGKLFHQSLHYTPVTKIYLLNNSAVNREYLILAETWCRPRGIESGEEKSFYHFLLTDSLIEVPLQYASATNYYHKNCFSVYTGVMCSDYLMNKKINSDFPQLTYDEKKKTINYDYYEYYDGIDSCFERRGVFKYVKGNFVETILINEKPDWDK